MKEYLVAVDLEGIHGIVGEPYKTMTDSADYNLACVNAVKEVNAVVSGLFDGGADRVTVWDNHGMWRNLDRAKIDPRVDYVNGDTPKKRGRIFFADEHSYNGMLCIGYHSKEGTVGGVLAHTYNSVGVQYYKINGKTVGELEVDQYTAAEYGFTVLLVASDLAGVTEAKEAFGDIAGVVTKIGSLRNEAELIPEQSVLCELYEKAREIPSVEKSPIRLPMPASFEVRCTRSEDAAARLSSLKAKGYDAHYSEDSHTVAYTLADIADIFP